MNDLQVKSIGFYGGEILGVKTPSGKIYMGARQACRDIGLTEDQARRQVKNIQTDLVLNKGVSNLALPTKGGIQEVLGIEVGFIPLWLAKISITPNMQKENPRTVERLIKYQLEAKDVLEQVFIEKKQIIPNNLSPELQVLIGLELKQKELETAVTENKQEIQDMRDVIQLDTTSWRKDTASLINKIALSMGGFEHIRLVREESYRLLNERMGVALGVRLTNKRRRMADEGVSKSKRDKLNYLDIIADDKKLIEGYVAIVKEMAIKYKVA